MKASDEPKWIYFDGNAVTALWDWHTKTAKEGKTGDPRSESPFEHAVLSDYSLDELITLPVGNAFKKHLLLLTIYPDIPVLLPIEQVDLNQAMSDRNLLLHEANFLSSVANLRARALIGDPVAVDGLAVDIENKRRRIRSDVKSAQGSKHVPAEMRVELDVAIDLTTESKKLNPRDSASDFLALCKTLYGFEITRFIDRSARTRKGPSRNLNQQIDYYHLAYLPFVDGFVSNDKTLIDIARVLCDRFLPRVQVWDVDSYHRHWIRERLS